MNDIDHHSAAPSALTNKAVQASDAVGLTAASTIEPPRSRAQRYNTILTVAAACVGPLLLLWFVNRYAVNSLQFDDWSSVPMLHSAVSGHPSFGQLWTQYHETRLFLANVIAALFAVINGYNTRSVVLFDVLVFTASYVILLVLVRRYLKRSLSPIPVLLIGLVWFSLADVQNALWAFQLSWYLVVFFFVTMIFALSSQTHRSLWFAVGVLSAVAASLSTIEGFILWPLGIVLLAWTPNRVNVQRWHFGAWIGMAILTVAVYIPGFDFSNNGCLQIKVATAACSPSTALGHPVNALRYLVISAGNVIPGGYWGTVLDPVRSFGRYEILGVILIGAALFIVVQSWRFRKTTEAFPLPLLLVVFALLFDLFIVLGRSGQGPLDVLNNNRYEMPNLILLVAIVVYAWGRMPSVWGSLNNVSIGVQCTRIILAVLGVFLVVQIFTSIGFGTQNGVLTRQITITQARLAVNLNRVPPRDRACELALALIWPIPASDYRQTRQLMSDAYTSHLAEFNSDLYTSYRRAGPPPRPAGCPSTGAA